MYSYSKLEQSLGYRVILNDLPLEQNIAFVLTMVEKKDDFLNKSVGIDRVRPYSFDRRQLALGLCVNDMIPHLTDDSLHSLNIGAIILPDRIRHFISGINHPNFPEYRHRIYHSSETTVDNYDRMTSIFKDVYSISFEDFLEQNEKNRLHDNGPVRKFPCTQKLKRVTLNGKTTEFDTDFQRSGDAPISISDADGGNVLVLKCRANGELNTMILAMLNALRHEIGYEINYASDITIFMNPYSPVKGSVFYVGENLVEEVIMYITTSENNPFTRIRGSRVTGHSARFYPLKISTFNLLYKFHNKAINDTI